MIDVSTSIANAPNWLVTGAGAINAPSISHSDGSISVTTVESIVTNMAYAGAGTLAGFDGFWVANLTFFVPDGATGLSLTFSGLIADDRTVLELNQRILGDFRLNPGEAGISQTGPGMMAFSDGFLGANDQMYDFTGVTSGTVTTGFLTGINNLTLIVNNTGDSTLLAHTARFVGNGDLTGALLNASVSFQEFVPTQTPEPASLSLFAIGLAPLAWWVKRRASR